MLQLSYETNSLLRGLTHMLAGGHIGSNNGANKREKGGGRGQESPQQPACVMRKLSEE